MSLETYNRIQVYEPMFLLMANMLRGSTTSVGPVLFVYANFKMLVLRQASSPTVNPTKGQLHISLLQPWHIIPNKQTPYATPLPTAPPRTSLYPTPGFNTWHTAHCAHLPPYMHPVEILILVNYILVSVLPASHKSGSKVQLEQFHKYKLIVTQCNHS